MNTCLPLHLGGRSPERIAVFRSALGLAAVAVMLSVFGCNGSSGVADSHDQHRVGRARTRITDELLHHAIDALYRQEEFDSGEMLQRTMDRLDQWVREQKPIPGWTPDPMIATLPDPLRELPVVANLGKLEFHRSDGTLFQEAVWLRDVSNWARGEDVEDVARAKSLFDWTVRNIQLEWDQAAGPAGSRIVQVPWETLLQGRGTALERAWVFILLARQQGLDAALLALPGPDSSAKDSIKPWLIGVLSEGEVYLLDPDLGVPIPGPDGIRLDDDGRLEVQPATLNQVVADESLLRKLDLDEGHPYSVNAKQLSGGVVALLEASPAYLEQRMAMVESRLTGEEKMVLTVDPSGQAQRFQRSPHVADARLWTMPYEVVQQRMRLGPQVARWQLVSLMPFRVGQSPALWKGRILHLKGNFSGEPNATVYYQLARPSDRELASADIPNELAMMYQQAKQNASYWLGLIAYDQENYRSATDYLSNRTLEAVENNPWTRGAHYNLGRIYEADRQYDKALTEYRTKSPSPDRHGNLLRARWLEGLVAPSQTEGSDQERKKGNTPAESSAAN